MDNIIALVFVYFACLGFGFLFNLRGKLIFIAPIGSVISWGAFLLFDSFIDSVILCSLLSAMVCSVFCETIARVMKIPVTVFMITAILPLVPGSGIYYTMLACISKNYSDFAVKGIETIGIAGAIAVGMILISTVFKIATAKKTHTV